MFARLTIVQWKSGKQDEALKIFRESVIPAFKSQKGSRGGYLLTDPKTGKGIAIAFWDSEEDAIASEKSYYQQQLSKFKDLFAAPPVREEYVVSVQEVW